MDRKEKENLRWHMEAAIERLLELPHEYRKQGTLCWDALYWLHEGLAGKTKGSSAPDLHCHICGAKPGEKHRGL